MPSAQADLISAFDTEWPGIVARITPNFLRNVTDTTVRKNIVLAFLQDQGRVQTNQSGRMMIFTLQADKPPAKIYEDGGLVLYNRHNLWEQGSLNWAKYISTDGMTQFERETAGGGMAIFDRWGEIIPNEISRLTQTYTEDLSLDGNDPNRLGSIHGFNSFTGTSGCTTSDQISEPDDDYAGLPTDLGAFPSSWSSNIVTADQPSTTLGSDWPEGTGSFRYDFNSPLLVNFNTDRWLSSSSAWADNCERVMRQAIIWQCRRCGADGMPDVAAMGSRFYADFKNFFSQRNRQLPPHRRALDLGFPESVNFDGVAVTHGYDVPSDTVNLWNIKAAAIYALGERLFGYRGPDYDPNSLGWVFASYHFGNTWMVPKYQAQIKNFVPA